MKKKYRRKLLILALAYFYLGQCGTVFGAASGNYTDLLPIGAAENTTVISRGTGWAITTLAPSQTFGDALSRAPMTVYQSTGSLSIQATTAVSTMTLTQGSVGSTTFPATWVAVGRSIRTRAYGTYSTPASGASGPSWYWISKLSTTTVMIAGGTSPGNQTAQNFMAESLITIGSTGITGSVIGTFTVLVSSGSSQVGASVVSFSTTTSASTVDLTTQLSVVPAFQWGSATSSVTVRNITVEFLN